MITASVVARTQAASGPPTLVELDGFVGMSGTMLTETLNQPEMLEFTILPSKQDELVLARFKDLTVQGTEIWLHRDNDRLFAGPLVGYSPGFSDGTILWRVRAAGLLDYTRRWRLEPDGPDLIFNDIDQAVIAKGLVDYWQNLEYGHYGIDTSNISATGVLRQRTYEALTAAPIFQRLSELSAVQNGFDFWIDPTTREFQVAHPLRGVDRSAVVQIDGRSIIAPEAQISIGPEDMVSEAFAVGEEELVRRSTNSALRENWGRTAFASGFQGVTHATTLQNHATKMALDRREQLHITPRTLYPTVIGWRDFELGDEVEFAYDYGAGVMVDVRRVFSRVLNLSTEGAEEIGVQLV